MPLIIANADQTINSKEELKLFMGQVVNAISNVQASEGKPDADLDKLLTNVNGKMNKWKQMAEEDFDLAAAREELKTEVLKPVTEYVSRYNLPKDVRIPHRDAGIEVNKITKEIDEQERIYDEIPTKEDSKKSAQMRKIHVLYETRLRPAQEKLQKIEDDWDRHPDNKQAQLRRELDNAEVFGKYSAVAGNGPNFRLKTPKSAEDSAEISKFLRMIQSTVTSSYDGTNAVHMPGNESGSIDPELQAILDECKKNDAGYAAGVLAAGGTYDASLDPVWSLARRFSGWMERNYGTLAHRNILEQINTAVVKEDLIDFGAPTYGLPGANGYTVMPELSARRNRGKTSELFSKDTLLGAPEQIEEKLSAAEEGKNNRVLHEMQLYGAFSKVLHDAEETAARERIGYIHLPSQVKGTRSLITAADTLMSVPGFKLQQLAEVDKNVKQLKELGAYNSFAQEEMEKRRQNARNLAGDPKKFFEDLSAVMNSPDTNPAFLEILKESFVNNRALFEAEKDYLPKGFMEQLRRGAKERGFEDEQPVNEEQPHIEEEKPPVEEEKPHIEGEQPHIEVQPRVEEENPPINKVFNIPNFQRDEMGDMLNGEDAPPRVSVEGPGVNGPAGPNGTRLLSEIRSADTAGKARASLDTMLDGMGRLRGGKREVGEAETALDVLRANAENIQRSLDNAGVDANTPLAELQVPEEIRKELDSFAEKVSSWCEKYPEKAKELDTGLGALTVPEPPKNEEEQPKVTEEQPENTNNGPENLENRTEQPNEIFEKPGNNPNQINNLEESNIIGLDGSNIINPNRIILDESINLNRINIINEKPSKPSMVRTERGLLENFPAIETAEQYNLFLTSMQKTLEQAQQRMQKEDALDGLSREDRKFMHRHVNIGDGKKWNTDREIGAIAKNVAKFSPTRDVTMEGLLDTVKKEADQFKDRKGKLSGKEQDHASKMRYTLNKLISIGNDDVLKDFVRDGVRNYTSPELESEVRRTSRRGAARTGGLEKFGRIRTKEECRWFLDKYFSAAQEGQQQYLMDEEINDLAKPDAKHIVLSEGGKVENSDYAETVRKKVLDEAKRIEQLSREGGMDEEEKKNLKKLTKEEKARKKATERSTALLGAMESVLRNEIKGMDEGDGPLSAEAELKIADIRRVYEDILENDVPNKMMRNYVGMYVRNVPGYSRQEAPAGKENRNGNRNQDGNREQKKETWQIEENGSVLRFVRREDGEPQLVNVDGEEEIDTVERDSKGRRLFDDRTTGFEKELYSRLPALNDLKTDSQKEDRRLLEEHNYADLRRKYGVPEAGLERHEAEQYLDKLHLRGEGPTTGKAPAVNRRPPVNNGNRPLNNGNQPLNIVNQPLNNRNQPVNNGNPPVNNRIPDVNRPDLPPVIGQPGPNGQPRKNEIGINALIDEEKNGNRKEGNKPENKPAPRPVSPGDSHQEETPKMKLGETDEGILIEESLPFLKENCEKLRLSLEKEGHFRKNSGIRRVKDWMLRFEEKAGKLLEKKDGSAAEYSRDLAELQTAYRRITDLSGTGLDFKKSSVSKQDLQDRMRRGMAEGLHAAHEEANTALARERANAESVKNEFNRLLRTEKNNATLKAAGRALKPDFTERLCAAATHMEELNKAPKKYPGQFMAFQNSLRQFNAAVQNKNTDPKDDPTGEKRKLKIAESALQLQKAARDFYNTRGISKKDNSYENQQYNCALYCLMLLDPDLAKQMGRRAQGKYDMTDNVSLKYETIVHNQDEFMKTYIPRFANKQTDPKTTEDFRKLATQENINNLTALYAMMEREDNVFHWRSAQYKNLMEKLGNLKNANRHFINEKDPAQVDAMAQQLKEVKEALDAYVPKHAGRRYSNDNRRFNISLAMQYMLAPEEAKKNAAKSQLLNPDLAGGLKVPGRNEKMTLDRLALVVTGAAKQANWEYTMNEKERKMKVRLKNFEEAEMLKKKQENLTDDGKKKGKTK